MYCTNGDYVGDDLAVFADIIVGDGDTKAAKKFIAEQIAIIGEMAADIAQCFPDIGHAVKSISSEWYRLAEKDKSLKGKQVLEPTQIRAMCNDVIQAFRWLRDKLKTLENPSDDDREVHLNKCLERLGNIVPHHCGDHSTCKAEVCGFVKLKEEHPDWSAEQLDEEYDKVARFKGEYMCVPADGAKKILGVITRSINKNNISQLAAMKTSNGSENFWTGVTVHSEGKR